LLSYLPCINDRKCLDHSGLIENFPYWFLFFSRETAGEEDHSTYNLGVLKKPVYALTDEEIIANGGRGGLNNIGKYNS
jgi:hypothetical protein